jgi:hypothetical protein
MNDNQDDVCGDHSLRKMPTKATLASERVQSSVCFVCREMQACNDLTPANDIAISPPLLSSYGPLDHMTVRQEVEALKKPPAVILEEWRKEESMYEESFYDADSIGSHAIETARRNYPNDSCKVKDPRLYPYHDACYPLLEAYTGNARIPNRLEVRLPGQLLCSVYTITRNSTVRGLSSSVLDPHS